MKKSLLIQVLSTFDRSELRQWARFLDSDYHLSNKKTKAVGQHIAALAPNWEHPQLEKRELWKKVFGTSVYAEAKLNNYVSDILEVTYTFIAQQELEQQPASQYDLLLRGLFKKNLHQAAGRVLKKWERTQVKNANLGPEELAEKGKIAAFQDTLGLLSSKRKYAETLQQKSDYLDRYYLLQQLIYYCEMLNRGKIIQGSYQLHHLDELLAWHDRDAKQIEQTTPSISIYARLTRLLLDEKLDDLNQLETLLATHPNALAKREQRTVYDFLFNFCIQQINSGRPAYYQKVFDLYRGLIQQDLLIREGRLSQWTYANIITTGSRLGEWAWTADFLENYQQYLPKQDHYNAYHYNRAALHYEQEQFGEALQLLHQVDFKDAFYYQAAKTIQFKIYYLLDEVEAFEALLAAARQFIHRNQQLSTGKKQSYLNFLRLIRQLFNLKQQRTYWNADKVIQEQRKLQERLADKEYPANHKDWLAEMLKLLS